MLFHCNACLYPLVTFHSIFLFRPNESVLKDSKRFTVLIKNQIEFIKFKIKRRNIIDIVNDKDYLRNCTYSSSSEIDRFCPIFELGTIARYANIDYDEISVKVRIKFLFKDV